MVLADLARLGYTVRWTTVGACRVGFCHHRHRVFVVATLDPTPAPAGEPIAQRSTNADRWVRFEPTLFGGRGQFGAWPMAGVMAGGLVWAQPVQVCGAPARRHVRRDADELALFDPDEAVPGGDELLPTPAARLGDEQSRVIPSPEISARRLYAEGRRNLEDAIGSLLPTPRASDAEKGGPNQRGSSGDLALPAAVQPERWGRYAAAVARHGLALGRRAPNPTVAGPRGGERLSGALTEWMLGLDEGWLMDVVGHKSATRLAGNGVCPQQALLGLVEVARLYQAGEMASSCRQYAGERVA